ncbi:phosphoenolpyruvate--protein phosphotransferase [Sphingomonas sp. So64.6b]|nr:phosphoenolpyruvate--protein phosphotransferase [Sphingomonas sp. So64.6b]QNA87139.1 phosphoenolpyruvate--protein phosphotransferase [Sphingomonas sp. So64.6b]
MTGWALPLDQVPDPVFADRMMGDGFAIDPLDGVVRAPCDATVIAIAPTLHSISLRLANGAELLIHVGLETVALAGDGFAAQVRDGETVTLGQPLLLVDLDSVALRAKSLITPMTVTSDGYAVTVLAIDARVTAGDPIAEVSPVADGAATADLGEDTAHCTIRVPLANGIHARPAARIVAALKPFIAEVTIVAHNRPANARSIVALLSAGIRHDDEIAIGARGPDARAAIATVAKMIEEGMGEEAHAPAPAPAPTAAISGDGLIHAVRAAPGLAIGPIFRFSPGDVAVAEQGAGIAAETTALDAARATLLAAAGGTAGAGADIAAAHRALIEDPELLGAAQALIAQGRSAAFAWRGAIRGHAEAIRATGDRLLIERIADLKDIERQVIALLTGSEATLPVPPRGAILIADELLPSHFASLADAGIAGICTAFGGPTAHASILAASAGLPMLVAAGPAILELSDGQQVVLDADRGTLDPAPDTAMIDMITARLAQRTDRIAAEAAAALDPCVMADGTRIEIFANLANAAEAAHAVTLGAEGCGLLRTEFLFLDRDTAPDEAEQRVAYAAVAAGLDGRPLIVRTLDIGGDKPVAYLPFPHEENPALGNRGIRFSLARPDLLALQFRAILAGVPAAQCRIMLPMIVDAGELAAARTILDEARAALGIDAPVPLGVMVETPAAAMLAASLAREADFLSIGSNDLTQYALAADRGNPAVAAKVDALHPAVLHLIARAAEGGRTHGRWLGVCGGIASDPLAAPILIGLGVTELSATPTAIPALKAVVRQLTLAECRTLADRALAASTAAEVHSLLQRTA